MSLANFSDEQLLSELIRRNGVTKAPKQRTMRGLDILVGIGKNHSVWINIEADELDVLRAMEARDVKGDG
mgnify:CR=1 FL=1